MKTLSATEAARNFSHVLDMLATGEEEFLIVRNKQPVATSVLGVPAMTALEAFGDIYRILPDKEGAAWLKDLRRDHGGIKPDMG